MRDPLDPIEKVRLNDTLRVRAPPGFRERVVAVAATEGIGLAEFARRAIVERVRRPEAAGSPTVNQDSVTASTQPVNPNISAARAVVTATTEAPASAAASTKRRDA